MANFGKRFPAVVYPRVTGPNAVQRYWPPRKLILDLFSYGAPGTTVALWDGMEHLSEVMEVVSPSDTKIKYHFINSADTSLTIDVFAKFFTGIPTSTADLNQYWDIELRAIVSGATWYTNFHTQTTNLFWPSAGWGTIMALGGPPNTHSPNWLDAMFRFRPALWEDDPAFHPYRH